MALLMSLTSSAGGIIGLCSGLQSSAMFSEGSIGLASSGPVAAGRKAGQQVRDTDADIDMLSRSNMLFTREVKRTREVSVTFSLVRENHKKYGGKLRREIRKSQKGFGIVLEFYRKGLVFLCIFVKAPNISSLIKTIEEEA